MALQIKINPFSINTAKSAWNNPNLSTPVRALQVISGIAYDILLKNPYELAVGNAKRVFFSKDIQTTPKQKIVGTSVIVLGSLYTLLLWGTNIHLLGRGILVLGSGADCPAIAKIGSLIKNFGKNVFVTGGVPVYGVFYALPKKIITSIPDVVRALAKKIEVVARWIFFSILEPVWNYVIYPLFKSVFHFFMSVAKKCAQAMTWILEHILIPLWNKAIAPILKALGKLIRAIVEKLADALGKLLRAILEKLGDALVWIGKNLLIPLWNQVIYPVLHCLYHLAKWIGNLLGKGLKFCFTKIQEALIWIIKNVLIPLWNQVIFPVLKLLHNLMKVLAESLQFLIKKTSLAAGWFFKHIMVPLWNYIISCNSCCEDRAD